MTEFKLGFLEVLTIVFLILKLTKVIAWSWWIVFSPLILGVILSVIVAVIIWKTWMN